MSGLYIHIPFCRKACHYCDFYFSTNLRQRAQLVTALCNEIRLQQAYLPDEPLETVYFGGGTPSLLTENELQQVFDAIYRHYSLQADAEITLEANPDDLTAEKLTELRRLPFNRLSIGIQSFSDTNLQFMNRLHTANEAEISVRKAQEAGFDNISLDLIYAVPNNNHSVWERDLQQAVALQVQHISAYCLTIEPQTAFGNWLKKGKIKPIDEDFAAHQFEMMTAFLANNGFEQYEISNFSLPGWHSRHNSNYWKGSSYLGIGPSAHSFNGSSRQWNVSHNQQFMEAIGSGRVPATQEFLSATDHFNEALLTGLRTKWGVNLHDLKARTGIDFYEKNAETAARFFAENLLFAENDTLKITQKGKLLADKITADLFLTAG